MTALTLRPATWEDSEQMASLIDRSVRQLSINDYSQQQIDISLQKVFGIDTQLIKDGTYYVVETMTGIVVGCGGWSYRKTLYGSDSVTIRDSEELDASVDGAKIRAFFVDPASARSGIGTMILEKCESGAKDRGFTYAELMSTIPGVRFYTAHGYVETSRHHHDLVPGLDIEFVAMRKELR